MRKARRKNIYIIHEEIRAGHQGSLTPVVIGIVYFHNDMNFYSEMEDLIIILPSWGSAVRLLIQLNGDKWRKLKLTANKNRKTTNSKVSSCPYTCTILRIVVFLLWLLIFIISSLIEINSNPPPLPSVYTITRSELYSSNNKKKLNA